MSTKESGKFWDILQKLVDESELHIDRQKGSAHPHYSDYIYPYDYGELTETESQDGAGIDCWIGSGNEKRVTGVIVIVDGLKKDSEIKILIDCSDDEMEEIWSLYQNDGEIAGVLLKRPVVVQSKNNYAFIDSQNLNLSILRAGWRLDWVRFRIYLERKYNVKRALLFIGKVSGNEQLYEFLESCGYELVFKPTIQSLKQGTKGNVDAELVLHTMLEYKNFDKAVIVTGDGDFYCLLEQLAKDGKLEKCLIPNHEAYSSLLKKLPSEYIAFVTYLKNRLEYKKKRTP